MFVGREYEIGLLRDFQKRRTAGLVVCRGRRRIGKSTLIEHFGSDSLFYEFYGLPPRKGLTNNMQLKHFGAQLGTTFGIPAARFENWHEALSTLAGLTSSQKMVILLDEISWMASADKDFPGILKGVWDTKFKKNSGLMLVLCGSVTSWIDDNILNDKGFMGRVSLTITLNELSLYDSNLFWQNAKHISVAEKFKLLCVTGGVPRYLEEIRVDQTAEENIKRMCFSPEGLLFSEFDKIFKDIFGRRSDSFERVIQALANGPRQLSEVCAQLDVKSTGGLSEVLSILETSNLVSRDFSWTTKGRRSAFSRYRIRDNYLRFYLKYIEPQKEKIERGLYRSIHLENLKGWETIMGYQTENLILNNLNAIVSCLGIPAETIVSASPYFQKKTSRRSSCQIDLLIHTKHSLYICEIKFRSKVERSVIDEVQEKVDKLKASRSTSIRTVLIYQGELSPGVERAGFFSNLIPFEKLLQWKPETF